MDGEEEMDGTEQDQVQRNTYTRSSRSEPWNKWRVLVLVGGVLVIFCVGECLCSLSLLLYLTEYHAVIIMYYTNPLKSILVCPKF